MSFLFSDYRVSVRTIWSFGICHAASLTAMVALCARVVMLGLKCDVNSLDLRTALSIYREERVYQHTARPKYTNGMHCAEARMMTIDDRWL